jgi:hypothetical protein
MDRTLCLSLSFSLMLLSHPSSPPLPAPPLPLPLPRAYTLKVVQQAHNDWARLWMGVTEKGKFVV